MPDSPSKYFESQFLTATRERNPLMTDILSDCYNRITLAAAANAAFHCSQWLQPPVTVGSLLPLLAIQPCCGPVRGLIFPGVAPWQQAASRKAAAGCRQSWVPAALFSGGALGDVSGIDSHSVYSSPYEDDCLPVCRWVAFRGVGFRF